MNLDPGIVCYEHCSRGHTFAFHAPPVCDLCGGSLADQPLLVPPFRVPYPFTRASQTACCIVIQPTKGDFLNDYHKASDLHIGLTDSEGGVYEYDEDGVHMDRADQWLQCLAIPFIRDSPAQLNPVWKEYWDCTLSIMADDWEKWSPGRYDEVAFNCYTFVIEFLKELRLPSVDTKNLTKMRFCADFIVRHTEPAARYISLYRRLLRQDFVAIPRISKGCKVAGEPLITTKC